MRASLEGLVALIREAHQEPFEARICVDTAPLLERSYEASSKVFTILDTVFASVLNLGEQTTVA